MRTLPIFLSFCAIAISGTAQATTVTDSGFGFVYLVSARDGSGSNDVFNDEAITMVSETVSGTLATNGGTNTATVTGNLATGKIGAVTEDADENAPANNALATINMVDTVFFDLSAFDSSYTVDVTFGFEVDGSYFTDGSVVSNGANVSAGFIVTDFASRNLTTIHRYAGDGTGHGILGTAEDPVAWDFIGTNGTFTARESDMAAGVITLFGGGVNEFRVELRLRVKGNADFGGTAAFFIDSPIAFTSASGVFLTEGGDEPPKAVPLPVSGLILSSGLFLMVGNRRRVLSRQ